MGIWDYYVGTLSFSDIDKYVKKIDQELHKSKTLSDLIQRSITDNYLNIKDYLLNQDERLFNSLVLAVYGGDPQWVEVELHYREEDFYNLGFLEFTGEEKIFPVDGQHRVEGIKTALQENQKLSTEKVPVIFIGHRNNREGMQRGRRLFSTLNRYAKPVSMSDIVALDEDDLAAIVTRELIEHFDLFSENRIVYAQQKGIPNANKTAITSIITLYQSNSEILKYFLKPKGIKSDEKYREYIKIRPSNEEVDEFSEFCFSFWKDFSDSLDIIGEYLSISDNNPALKFRNNSDGGHLIFRPIGFLSFIMSAIEIKSKKKIDFSSIFDGFNNVNLYLNRKPWLQVLWNSYEKKMITGSDTNFVKLMLMYLADKSLLTEQELKKLKKSYAAKIDHKDVDSVLELLA